MIRAVAIAAMLLTASASPAAAPPSAPIERIGHPMMAGKPLPFSEAVRAGDMVYLSGQVGRSADGRLPAGIAAQTRQAMDNIGATLKGAGLGWGDVARCTVMLGDMKDWPAFNAVYASYFPDGRFPARSAFGANGLALGAAVEIECQAYAGARRR